MFSLDTEVRHYLTTFVYDLHSRVEVEVFFLYFCQPIRASDEENKEFKDG